MKRLIQVHTEPDLELWQSIVKNEQGAFSKLFKKYREPLERFASLYLCDPSERDEVLQEVFIELYQKRGKIKIDFSLPSFLVRLTKFRILNYLRHKSIYQKHIQTAGGRKYSYERNTEEAIDYREASERIQDALALMPRQYRQVYILNKEYQLTVPQTAGILKRPVPTVEKQLRKALSYLKDGLSDLIEINHHLKK